MNFALMRRYRRLYYGFLGGAMVLLWTGNFMNNYSVGKSAEQSLRVRAQFDVLLLEEHLSRTLDSIAGQLAAVKAISGSSNQGARPPSAAVLADLIVTHNEVRSISLVDGEGRVLASSNAENVGMRVSADILPQGAASGRGEMHLGGIAPYRDLQSLALGGPPESSGMWLAALPARDPPEALKWVAVINTGFFENFWERLYGASALKIGVFDYSGRPLVNFLGSDLDAAKLGAQLVRRVEVAERGMYDDEGTPALMVSYRSSAAYPLILAVVSDRRTLQAELADDRRTATLAMMALSAVIAFLLWFFYRGQLRYYLLDERLSEERRQRDAATLASEERRVMEVKLRESQKLEAIGQLTGGLAHDFNNLLGIVVGNLDLIEERLAGADERLRRQFDAAREAALRGAEVTRALLAVARRQPLEVQSLDINTLLLEMMTLVRSSAGAAVSVSAQLAPETLVARIDVGGLSNAVLNLVINARDAMQGQAGEHRITLRTSREQIAADADPDLAPGDYAVLEVSDNGPGMSELVRTQVFEPFFTTKERDKGTGLGLSMVRGFAEQLGGTARIDSTQGTGTTVRLYLPLDATATQSADAGAPALVQPPATTPAAHAAQAPKDAAPRRVLVVDDEAGLCEVACTWLQSRGYETTSVLSPDAALAQLAGQHFDVLFTDVVMPGSMDGIDLARAS